MSGEIRVSKASLPTSKSSRTVRAVCYRTVLCTSEGRGLVLFVSSCRRLVGGMVNTKSALFWQKSLVGSNRWLVRAVRDQSGFSNKSTQRGLKNHSPPWSRVESRITNVIHLFLRQVAPSMRLAWGTPAADLLKSPATPHEFSDKHSRGGFGSHACYSDTHIRVTCFVLYGFPD